VAGAFSGSAPPRFSSSTIDSSAEVRAAVRFAGVSSEVVTRFGSVRGFENMPARYFSVSTWRTELSSWVIVILPDASSAGPLLA